MRLARALPPLLALAQVVLVAPRPVAAQMADRLRAAVAAPIQSPDSRVERPHDDALLHRAQPDSVRPAPCIRNPVVRGVRGALLGGAAGALYGWLFFTVSFGAPAAEHGAESRRASRRAMRAGAAVGALVGAGVYVFRPEPCPPPNPTRITSEHEADG